MPGELRVRYLNHLSFPVTAAAVAEWYRYQTVACFVTGSSPVPLKTRRVGQRCTLNLSRAETSSRWCGVVVRRGGASSGVVHVTPWFKITWSVAKSPRVAEQCDVNIQSINSRSLQKFQNHGLNRDCCQLLYLSSCASWMI
ncbi:uncharacterized protein TNCV_4400051 [Trichonephila clavipes]|nr:uncharacterized protein TNCV_4400051 [Trichonephila clavipes]